MDGNQAIVMIDSWKRILIAGKPEQISAMLADVEARFEKKGFARDPAAEKTMDRHPYQRNTVFCFVGGPQGRPRLLFCLNRVSERRVRGERCSVVDWFPAANALEVAEAIDGVIADVIISSANDFGLEVKTPRLGPNSSVPPRTMAALIAFSDVAAGELPLSTTAETAWRKFLIAAGQEDVIIDADELMGWFNANGWSFEASRHLNDRFFSESTLLSEFAEAIRS